MDNSNRAADNQAIADLQTGKIDKAIITVALLPGLIARVPPNTTMRYRIIEANDAGIEDATEGRGHSTG